MKNTERLLLTIAHPLRSLLARRSFGRIPRTDEAEPLRLAAAGGREADFRDRSLLPLLRAETLDRFEPPASWPAALGDEARAYVEEEIALAWEGPARMADRPNEAWGRAYDFTIREGSRDPFLAWMSVVGQHRWHWDGRARAQLSELETAWGRGYRWNDASRPPLCVRLVRRRARVGGGAGLLGILFAVLAARAPRPVPPAGPSADPPPSGPSASVARALLDAFGTDGPPAVGVARPKIPVKDGLSVFPMG